MISENEALARKKSVVVLFINNSNKSTYYFQKAQFCYDPFGLLDTAKVRPVPCGSLRINLSGLLLIVALRDKVLGNTCNCCLRTCFDCVGCSFPVICKD